MEARCYTCPRCLEPRNLRTYPHMANCNKLHPRKCPTNSSSRPYRIHREVGGIDHNHRTGHKYQCIEASTKGLPIMPEVANMYPLDHRHCRPYTLDRTPYHNKRHPRKSQTRSLSGQNSFRRESGCKDHNHRNALASYRHKMRPDPAMNLALANTFLVCPERCRTCR